MTNTKMVQEAFSKCAKYENKYNAVLANVTHSQMLGKFEYGLPAKI